MKRESSVAAAWRLDCNAGSYRLGLSETKQRPATVDAARNARMSVVIEIPGELARYTDGESEVAVQAATLGTAFAALFARFPDLRTRLVNEQGRVHPWILVFLNGEKVIDVQADQRPLNDHDRIETAVLASGG